MSRVTWRGITTDAESAECWEAAATDPRLDDVLIEPIPGYGSYRDNAASGGTDNGGGHGDFNLVGRTDEQCRRVETVYRSYGNAAYWRPERRPDGTRYGWQNHLHVLRIDCADLSPDARRQVTHDYFGGWSGLPIGGELTRDSGTRAYVDRRWLTIKQEMADMFTKDQAAQLFTTYPILVNVLAADPARAPRVAPSYLIEGAAKQARAAATAAASAQTAAASAKAEATAARNAAATVLAELRQLRQVVDNLAPTVDVDEAALAAELRALGAVDPGQLAAALVGRLGAILSTSTPS